MAHDGQKIELDATVILSDLLTLTRDALPAVDDIVARATVAVRTMVSKDGRMSGQLIE